MEKWPSKCKAAVAKCDANRQSVLLALQRLQMTDMSNEIGNKLLLVDKAQSFFVVESVKVKLQLEGRFDGIIDQESESCQ